MALNNLVKKAPYELNRMKNVIEETQGEMWSSVLDFKGGLYYIEIEEKDKHKAAFEYGAKGRVWNGLVMGFKIQYSVCKS